MPLTRAIAIALLSASASAFAQGEDPLATLLLLEARVLAAPHVTIEAEVTATGALAAHYTGVLDFKERNRSTGAWQGELRGAPSAVSYSADGRAFEMKGEGGSRGELTGRESNHALLAGALRMGIAHNLLRLAALQAPDHAGEGFDAWAALVDFRPTTVALGGEMQGAVSLGYDLKLDGVEAGSIRLWLDPVTGLPRRQQYTRRTPEGEVTVVEEYKRFALE
jgi:hypothetical protein